MNKRRRFKQTLPLEQRLVEDTARLREQARAMRPGPALDSILKRIRRNETAAHLTEWLKSPGLKAPT